MKIILDPTSEIVIKQPWWYYVAAWGMLVVGLLLFVVLLPESLDNPTSGAWIGVGGGLLIFLFGIWGVRMTTKVTFDQPLGHITVSRPAFLWFSRKKVVISKEEARSAYVDPDAEIRTLHNIAVIMKSGKMVRFLYLGQLGRDKADYVAERIRDWANKGVVIK